MLYIVHRTLKPSGQNSQKYSLKECDIVNSRLKIQCHIVKNTLLDCLFGDFAHWEITVINYNNKLQL